MLAFTFCFTEFGRIVFARRTWIKLLSDAFQPGSNQSTERDIGIRASIHTFQFKVIGLLFSPPERRDHAHCCLAIIKAPCGICGTPHVCLQSPVRIVTAAGPSAKGRKVSENTGNEVTPGLAESARILWVIEQVTTARSIPRSGR